MTGRLRPLRLLCLAPIPAMALARGGTHTALGRESPDLLGHLWTIWHATREPLTSTRLIGWPEGVDLLPILGGWGDILLASAVAPALGVVGGWNVAMATYLLLAGVGGWALSRALGAGPWAALLGGLVLQLDPATLQHLSSGRGEQVGIGMLALFLAAGVHTLSRSSWRGPAALAACGAGSLLVAWEYGLFVALFGGILLLGAPDTAGRRRLLLGGGGAVLLSLPLVLPFVGHSAGAPPGRFVDDWVLRAANNALVPLDPSGWAGALPSAAALAAVVALPWTAQLPGLPRRATQRLRWAAGLGLLLSLTAALGPVPRLTGPPGTTAQPWAPFTWLHALPLASRYQTPVRLLVPWSLLGAAAVAVATSFAGSRRRWVGAALGGATLVCCGIQARGLLPSPGFRPAPDSELTALAQDPHPGAVFDLPAPSPGGRRIDRQLAQMVHERPIRHHSLQVYLEGHAPPPVDPFLTWTRGRPGAGPAQDQRQRLALHSLRDRDFGWVLLHRGEQKAQRDIALADRLTGLLGPPTHESVDWAAWKVPAPASAEPAHSDPPRSP